MADNRVYIPVDPMQFDRLERTIEKLDRTISTEGQRTAQDRQRIEQRIDRAATITESTGNLAQRTAVAGAQVTGLIGAGALGFQNRRRFIPFAQNVFRGQMLAQAAGAPGAGGLLGRAAQFASSAHPILKMAAAVVGLGLLLKKATTASEKNTRAVAGNTRMAATWGRALSEQTRTISGLAIAARQRELSGLSPMQADAFRRAQADPLGRGFAELQQRQQARGVAVTRTQVALLTTLAAAEQDLLDARAQTARSQAQLIAPYQIAGRAIQTEFERFRALGAQGFTDPSASTTGPLYNRIVGSLGFGARRFRDEFLAGAFGLQPGFTAAGFGIPEETTDPSTAAARRLARLQFRGPAGTMDLPPTVRAGTRGEHEFRVRAERQQLYFDAQRVWQDQILELMTQLVELSRLDPEVLARTEIQFGREVTEGVE